jgi:hypothetical protein
MAGGRPAEDSQSRLTIPAAGSQPLLRTLKAMRQNRWASSFGGELLLFLAGAALACFLSSAARSNAAPPGKMESGVTILTPTEGVDFQPYANQLSARVKRNWYAIMPEPALKGKKAIVVLTFHIQRDGKVAAPDPTLERTSRSQELDDAAMKAIHDSAPFDPLPEAFHGPNIQLRFIFFYNVAIPKDFTYPSDSRSNLPSNASAPRQ